MVHRLTRKSYSDPTATANYYYDQSSYNGLTIYNGNGRRTGMSDGSGATAWSFDAMGRALTEARTIAGTPKTIGDTFNYDGSLASLTYPSGRTITYGVDSLGRPQSAVDSANGINYALNATYAAQGALASELNGQSGSFAGVTYSLGYNNRLWPSSISASSSNGTALSLSYGYFANGNVNVITNNRDNGRTVTYGYDSLNRISSASTQATSGADCWGQAVPSGGYDRYANLLAINVTKCSAPSLSIGVNGNNQVNGFSYDAAGDVINDGTYSYSWDAEGRMTAAGSTTYTYDGDGQRVKKSSGTLYWRGADGSVLAETDTLGNTVNEYIFFGARIARRDSSGNVYYYFGSALGSATITNSTGSLCYDADFYPFGGELAFTNNCAQNYKFAGMEQDSETGDYHTWFRQYNPNQGRWLSPDPLAGDITNPQSLNRYAYVMNNPTSLIDRLGLQGDDSGFAGVDCRDPSYADSHAECRGPGSPWCFVNPNDPSCWYFPPPAEDGGGGGGGGGSTGGDMPRRGTPPTVTPIPDPCGVDSTGEPLPCPGVPVWAIVLGGTSVVAVITVDSSAQVPQQPQPSKLPSCFGVFLSEAGNQLFNPSLSLSTAADVGSVASLGGSEVALSRAVAVWSRPTPWFPLGMRGVPLSAWRAGRAISANRWFVASEALGKVSGALAVGSVIFAEYQGLRAEIAAVQNGACQ